MSKNVFVLVVILVVLSFAGVKRDYKKALKANTISVFEGFIKEHPNNEFLKDVNQRLDTLYYNEAKKGNSIASFNRYLIKSPEGVFKGEMLKNIEDLDFHECSMQNTIEYYNNYLNKYPNGRYSGIAKDKIENLYYKNSTFENTIESYESYLEKYPSGKYEKEAKQQLEEVTFENSQNVNTISSYKSYLIAFPKGKYVDVCKKKILSLVQQDIQESLEGKRNIRIKGTLKVIKQKAQKGVDYIISNGRLMSHGRYKNITYMIRPTEDFFKSWKINVYSVVVSQAETLSGQVIKQLNGKTLPFYYKTIPGRNNDDITFIGKLNKEDNIIFQSFK